MKTLIPGCAVGCFVSFGWGMARHFRRGGRPSRLLLAIGLAAPLSAALQLTALARLPVARPAIPVSFYAAGLMLFWWAVSVSRGQLSVCGEPACTGQVVARGPYRYIRHPFYTSYMLVWIAGFAATAWWPCGVSALLMTALYECAARSEERAFLAGPLAAEYRRYIRQTGRYLPAAR